MDDVVDDPDSYSDSVQTRLVKPRETALGLGNTLHDRKYGRYDIKRRQSDLKAVIWFSFGEI